MNIPIQAFIHWFRGCPEDVRQMLTFFLLVRLTKPDLLADREAQLLEWINAPPKASQLEFTGRILALRALVDFVMAEHEKDEYWERVTDNNLNIVDWGLTEKDVRQMASNTISKIPQSKAEWLGAAQSWHALCRDVLSDTAIRDWERRESDAVIRRGP